MSFEPSEIMLEHAGAFTAAYDAIGAGLDEITIGLFIDTDDGDDFVLAIDLAAMRVGP